VKPTNLFSYQQFKPKNNNKLPATFKPHSKTTRPKINSCPQFLLETAPTFISHPNQSPQKILNNCIQRSNRSPYAPPKMRLSRHLHRTITRAILRLCKRSFPRCKANSEQ
jgi:hypothetical protein